MEDCNLEYLHQILIKHSKQPLYLIVYFIEDPKSLGSYSNSKQFVYCKHLNIYFSSLTLLCFLVIAVTIYNPWSWVKYQNNDLAKVKLMGHILTFNSQKLCTQRVILNWKLVVMVWWWKTLKLICNKGLPSNPHAYKDY